MRGVVKGAPHIHCQLWRLPPVGKAESNWKPGRSGLAASLPTNNTKSGVAGKDVPINQPARAAVEAG